jgi:hypothetical protein
MDALDFDPLNGNCTFIHPNSTTITAFFFGFSQKKSRGRGGGQTRVAFIKG